MEQVCGYGISCVNESWPSIRSHLCEFTLQSFFVWVFFMVNDLKLLQQTDEKSNAVKRQGFWGLEWTMPNSVCDNFIMTISSHTCSVSARDFGMYLVPGICCAQLYHNFQRETYKEWLKGMMENTDNTFFKKIILLFTSVEEFFQITV